MKIHDLITEVINEELIVEKLITYSNRAPYGQVVFLAGGAGSGKGFAISNFLDSAGFKLRDVDEMKKQLQILNRIGKITIDQIISKYGKSLSQSDIDNIRAIQADGYKLQNMNLRDPKHVMALHSLVKAMGIKDKSLANMLAAQTNPEVLPNIMFDITAKDITDITEVLPQLKAAGYQSQNIHLTWILTNYMVAMKNNKSRERQVPEDILLKTHEGAGNTIWGIITRALPKGMNGRVDVVLNNPENTVYMRDAEGNEITGPKGQKYPSDFLSLPLKKAGSSVYPESLWKEILFKWVKENAPKTITANMA
jgi:predicted kinase